MSAKSTHYKVLKVSETATPEEIKTAWRDLAKKYHPDRNKGKKAAARIKDVNVAYHELSDPGRRFTYDAKLRAERAAEAAARAAAASAASPFTDDDDDSTVPPSGLGNQTSPPTSGQPPATNAPVPAWTAADALRAVGQLLWNRLRPFAIAAFSVLALMAGGTIVVFLLFVSHGTVDRTEASPPVAATQPAVPRQDDGSGSNLHPASFPSSAQSAASSVNVRLDPIAYSYTTRSWANFDPMYSSGYPHIYGLGFHNRLGWGATMSWTGNYSASGNQLILSIENLRLPGEVESTLARQMGQLDWWSDVGVGYHVELHDALFEDHSMVKDLLIFRTFMGDTPPPRIEKTFRIMPTGNGEPALVDLRGEWRGTYEWNGDRVPFLMRLEQEGDELSGSAMEISADRRRQSSIRGRVEGSQVSFLKRYGDGSGAVSYVSSNADSRRLKGTWQKGFEQGSWEAEWIGDFTDTVDDLSTMIPRVQVASRAEAPKHQDEESWRLRTIDQEWRARSLRQER